MNKNSIKLNYLYNLTFQIFSMITPLVTTPYISRVFSADGIGRFSFSASVIFYFCLFAALGFSFYGQREIAKYQGNREKQSLIFWEILFCKLTSGAIAFAFCWVLIALDTFSYYTPLIKIMSIEIISTSINIGFFFQGNEKFKIIAVRDFIIRCVGILLILGFVKKQDDLWLYALCIAGSTMLSALLLWTCLKNNIVRVKFNQLKPSRHFFPSLRLFVPTIAISIFTVLDKTLIGMLIPGDIVIYLADGSTIIKRIADIENGYYAQSEKIIKLSMMVLASLGTVMMPRNAKELEMGREDVFINNINKAIEFVFFIGAPIAAGIAAIAFNFSSWFFGSGYDKVPILMMIFAAMVLPAGIGNVLGHQYLIPRGEDTKYLIVYVATAILNFSLNILLIPGMLSYGAAIASVIAESFAPLLMLFFLKDKIILTQILMKNWKPLLSAAFMFLIVYITNLFMQPSIINTTILILEGVFIYSMFVLFLKCRIAYEAIAIIKRRRL